MMWIFNRHWKTILTRNIVDEEKKFPIFTNINNISNNSDYNNNFLVPGLMNNALRIME
jgi:hypothetical protein